MYRSVHSPFVTTGDSSELAEAQAELRWDVYSISPEQWYKGWYPFSNKRQEPYIR